MNTHKDKWGLAWILEPQWSPVRDLHQQLFVLLACANKTARQRASSGCNHPARRRLPADLHVGVKISGALEFPTLLLRFHSRNASVIAGKFKTSLNSKSFFPPVSINKKASVNIRWIYQAFWGDAWVLYPEKSRGDSPQNVLGFSFPLVRFHLTWRCAPSHRIIRAEAFSLFVKPSVSRGGFGRGGAISMLIGAFLLVSIPPSLRPMLFPQHCVFLALTFLYLLSHPQTLNLIAVVLQHSFSPLSLCLLLRSLLPLSFSFCLVWWMESLDCEQHILGGAWQPIAARLTSQPVCGCFLLFSFTWAARPVANSVSNPSNFSPEMRAPAVPRGHTGNNQCKYRCDLATFGIFPIRTNVLFASVQTQTLLTVKFCADFRAEDQRDKRTQSPSKVPAVLLKTHPICFREKLQALLPA